MQRLTLIFRGLTVAFALTLVPGVAGAGVTDSPLPELLPGAKTNHLYSVPGVTASDGSETFFSCTSLEKTATIQVGVEIFATAGFTVNDPVATSLSFGPGETYTFGTDTAPGISVFSDLGVGGSNLSARILATSKKLMCTAFVADGGNIQPTSAWQLTIIRKTKQKAANYAPSSLSRGSEKSSLRTLGIRHERRCMTGPLCRVTTFMALLSPSTATT